jgi:hypothetical protein
MYQDFNKEVAEENMNICETMNRLGVKVDRNIIIIGMFQFPLGRRTCYP